jgi:regulatory protein
MTARAASDPADRHMRAEPPADPVAAGPPGDPESVARIVCLRLLEQRARTRAELATALRRKDVPDGAAQRVLDRFTEIGLIDDASLAEDYAQAQQRERGLSGRAIAQKLRQRGVGDADVLAAVEVIDDEREEAVARALVAKRVRSLAGLDPLAQSRRLVALLARKGYSAGLAYRVVREVLADPALADIMIDS